jgi:AraC family transcriptional regulator, chitin signaling transcriptional activator
MHFISRFFWILWGASLCSFSPVSGQTQTSPLKDALIEGTPRIIHFTRKDFQGDPQFWGMAQGHDGLLYFGNNDGALIFDGETWQRVKLPNNSSIRSLKVSLSGTVYAGGYNELGTIERDGFGKFYYKSLTHLLRPEDRAFENIWQIHEAQGKMIFRAVKLLITISDNKAVTIPTASTFDFSTVLDNRLYLKEADRLNVVDLSNMQLRTVVRQSEFFGEDLLALLPGTSAKDAMLVTRQGSLFRLLRDENKVVFWQKLLRPGSNNLLTSAIKATNGNYYVGTLRTKVISLGKTGEPIQTNSAFSTIQDNTVLNLFESAEGNIWVLLNNGIDYIDLSSPVSTVFEDASVYDVKLLQDNMYIASNQGVSVAKIPENKSLLTTANFQNVAGLEGQAWSLQYFEGQLLCSHDRGLFIIAGDKIRHINGTQGVWKTIAVKDKPGYYFACDYTGITVVSFTEERGFEVVNRLEGFPESSRDILQGDEPGVFWICHGYKGVYRIKVDDDLKRVLSFEHFKDQNGLPSPFNINVARWKSEIIFTTNNGIFTYDGSVNKFVPHKFLNDLFGTDKNVRRIIEAGDRTWFAHENEVGFFTTSATNPQLQKDFFLQLKGTFNPSMECIVPVNENTVLLGTNTGLFSFDLGYTGSQKLVNTIITSVSFKDNQREQNSELANSRDTRPRYPFNTNGIEFQFAAPGFRDKFNIQYSYWLEGAEQGWSPWSEMSAREYSLLRAGRYAFHVKARSLLGEKADEAVYHFQILPAWYQTRLAISLYVLVGLAALILSFALVKRRIRKVKEKTIAEEKEKRKVLELELQRIRLVREKEEIKKDKDLLEEDVIHKSKELANYTMLLVKKRELLNVMHEELKELKEAVKNDISRQKLRELIKKINLNLQDEEYIKVFEANFERVHHEFFTQLKSTFPDLTSKELQLCAFVRMNLTNKEIASILNISVRGVETARYRLRKRLGMSQEEDMGQFLEKLYSSQDAPIEETRQNGL